MLLTVLVVVFIAIPLAKYLLKLLGQMGRNLW